MAHPEVAEATSFKGIQKATLDNDVFNTGELFLLSITRSKSGQNQSWCEGWLDIVASLLINNGASLYEVQHLR
ncbi:hypothetical protein [Methylobacter sp.]|uniref:hypothetical protein n=1 Tax=Methylobacter sp. TaxID=2051955 RepID=UPI003DA1DECE